MKYLIRSEEQTTITRETVIEADTVAEAEAVALEQDWRDWPEVRVDTSAEIVEITVIEEVKA